MNRLNCSPWCGFSAFVINPFFHSLNQSLAAVMAGSMASKAIPTASTKGNQSCLALNAWPFMYARLIFMAVLNPSGRKLLSFPHLGFCFDFFRFAFRPPFSQKSVFPSVRLIRRSLVRKFGCVELTGRKGLNKKGGDKTEKINGHSPTFSTFAQDVTGLYLALPVCAARLRRIKQAVGVRLRPVVPLWGALCLLWAGYTDKGFAPQGRTPKLVTGTLTNMTVLGRLICKDFSE